MTTATCSDLQLSTNAVLCQFRLSSVACDLVENPSTVPPVSVTLKGINYNNVINDKIQLFLSYIIVPNVPQVTLVPSYSVDNQALQKLFIITAMNQTVSGCML